VKLQGVNMQNKIKSVLNRAINIAKKEVFEIEHREDLSEKEKVSQIIKVFSGICAAVAVQPIPFADFFILVPIQAVMGTRIAAIYQISVTERKVTTIIKRMFSLIGMGLLAQQAVIGAYKFIPYLGVITTIPIVFGLTYAIGKVMDYYFYEKAEGRSISKETIEKLWHREKEKGRAIGKKNRNAIEEKAEEIKKGDE